MGMRLDGWWTAFFLAVIIHIAVWTVVSQGLLGEIALEPKIEYMEIEMTPPARPVPQSQAAAAVPAGRPNNNVVNNQGRAALPAASPGAAAALSDAMPAAVAASGDEPGAVAAISGGYGAAAGTGGAGGGETGSAAVADSPRTEPDRRPSIAYAPSPEYPSEARINRWQGTVLVSALVTASGSVAEASVAKSSGYDELDQAAEAVLYRWRFNPGFRDGRPVSAWINVPVTFKLR